MHGKMKGNKGEFQSVRDNHDLLRRRMLSLPGLGRHLRDTLRTERVVDRSELPGALGELSLAEVVGFNQYMLRGGAEGPTAVLA